MQTPLKQQRRSLTISKVKYDFNKFFKYSFLIGASILAGSFMQIIFKLDINTIGKDSILTGLPFIRNAFFIFPILINILLVIWTAIIFTQITDISNSMNNNIWKFFDKIKIGFLFTNLTHLLMFYLILYYLYVPIVKNYEFRFSGHVLASIFSGGIFTNIEQICENFKNQNIKKELMEYAIKICKFFIYHNIYTIFWTAWIYHSPRETVLSFIITFCWVNIINIMGIDRIIISLLNGELQKRFDGKEKNRVFDNLEY